VIVVGVIVLIFAVAALTIPPAILIQEYRGHGLSRFEQFISEYDGIIISIGTAILIAILGLAATHMANRAALQREELAGNAADQREQLANRANEFREKANRRVQTELQLAKFRQAWIIEMRDDLSIFARLLFEEKSKENNYKIFELYTKIRIRLNLEAEADDPKKYKEPLAKALFDGLNNAQNASRAKSLETGADTDALVDLALCSHDFLRNEWGRLKDDLKAAQGLSENDD